MVDQRHNEKGAGGLSSTLTPDEKRALKGQEFFGFEIRQKKTEDDPNPENTLSFVPKAEENESSQLLVTAGGFFGQTIDVRGDSFANERDLISKYRSAAMQPEVDQAISDIVNETIVSNDEDLPVALNMEHTSLSKEVKEKITNEFDHILKKLDFRKFGSDIFRRWYIDGKIAYHIVVDLKEPARGIQDLRAINPVKIRRIKEVEQKQDTRTGTNFIVSTEEYFVYSEDGFATSTNTTIGAGSGMQTSGLKIPKDSICYVTSGLTDATRSVSLSYLHKALRNVNQLRMMEDALIIYRLSRAPERRVFNIDVGDMPKKHAESYINSLMTKYKNKLSYNAETGEVTSDRRHQHMLEDFWVPKTSSGKGTTIDSLPGGQNLGEIEDIEYFQKKLYQALNVPISRLDSENTPFNIGRPSEINRDELRFQKFIDRLRIRFGVLFKDLLRVQLVLKGVITNNEWDDIKEDLIVDYNRDNYFVELKEAEILKERIDTLNTMGFEPNMFFSKEYVRREILKQTEAEIKEIKNQIRKEALNNDALPNAEADGAIEGDGAGGIPGGDVGLDGGLEGDFDDFEGEDDETFVGDPEGAATELGPEDDIDLETDEEFDDEEL